MPSIQGLATITSKGQITLPKPIRQALGVDTGGKVAFEIKGSQIVVTRATSNEHADPAIGRFLALIEHDIARGERVSRLPPALAKSLARALKRRIDLTAEIEGDVSL